MAQTKEEKAAYSRAYYAANREKILAEREANREANREEKAAYHRAYQEANKEKLAEQRKAYYEANKEKLLAYQKAYREANKEKIAAYQKANTEKKSAYKKAYYIANKEKIAECNKAYREANTERIASLKARYRALRRKQVPVHLRDCPNEKQRIVQIYKLRNLLSEATGIQHHVDHMWPLADGGPHWSGNLQVIPAEENLSKNASVCEATKATVIQSLYSFESERPI